MSDIIRSFRDLPDRHVYFTAKCEKSTDEQGRMLYAPAMPGNKLAQSLPISLTSFWLCVWSRDKTAN